MQERSSQTVRRANQWWVTAMLAIAGLLIPIAITLSWLSLVILDADRFASTVTPIFDAPANQAILVDALLECVDTSLTNAANDSRRVSLALQAAGGQAAVLEELRSLADRVVATEGFRNAWSALNYSAHNSIAAVLANEPDASGSAGDQVITIDPDIITLLGVQPGGRAYQVLVEIPEQLGPRLEVLHTVDIPAARFVIEHTRTLTLVTTLITTLLIVVALWLSHDRRRALIRGGLFSLISFPIALIVRSVLSNQLSDIPGVQGKLAREYTSALTAPLESGLLMAATLGGIIALVAWFWERFDRQAALPTPS